MKTIAVHERTHRRFTAYLYRCAIAEERHVTQDEGIMRLLDTHAKYYHRK